MPTVRPSDLRGMGDQPAPQIDEGTSNLKDPQTGSDVGLVYVEHPSGQPWTEHWVVFNASSNNGDGNVRIEWAKPATSWAEVKSEVLAGNHPDLKYTKMEFDYENYQTEYQYAPPSSAEMPGRQLARRFNVFNSPTDLVKRGELFRESKGADRVDHWRLWEGYVKPKGPDAAASFRTTLQEVATPGTLQEFLTANSALGGEYVKVTYTWGGLA